MNARSLLDGHLATRDGTFVFAATTIPKIMYYEIAGDAPQKKWEDMFYDSYYQVKDKRIKLDPNETFGVVRGIEFGEKYVYVLFLDVP